MMMILMLIYEDEVTDSSQYDYKSENKYSNIRVECGNFTQSTSLSWHAVTSLSSMYVSKSNTS